MNLTYQKAAKADADLLVELYNVSFYDDYMRYGECPGYGRTREEMERSIEKTEKYIIQNEDVSVGVLSFQGEGDGHYYLGCLCVIPAFQGKGIGTQAFQYMLSVCPDWRRITLVTPADKEQNIRFYTQKCGFRMGEKILDGKVEVVQFYWEHQ